MRSLVHNEVTPLPTSYCELCMCNTCDVAHDECDLNNKSVHQDSTHIWSMENCSGGGGILDLYLSIYVTTLQW